MSGFLPLLIHFFLSFHDCSEHNVPLASPTPKSSSTFEVWISIGFLSYISIKLSCKWIKLNMFIFPTCSKPAPWLCKRHSWGRHTILYADAQAKTLVPSLICSLSSLSSHSVELYLIVSSSQCLPTVLTLLHAYCPLPNTGVHNFSPGWLLYNWSLCIYDSHICLADRSDLFRIKKIWPYYCSDDTECPSTAQRAEIKFLNVASGPSMTWSLSTS